MSELLRSWLFAALFVLGLSLGAMANLMVHALTGGRWGVLVRPALRAAASMVPIAAVLFVPIVLGVHAIYPWTQRPGVYLNTPFWIARSVAYLVIWSLLAAAFLGADRDNPAPEAGGLPRARRLAAGGLIVYTLTVSLAAFDWIAALMPEWYSSGFGLLVGTGQMLAGMAFGVAVAAYAPGARTDEPGRFLFHDLGNLLLMYVLTWAYLAYTQFLIIWSENLPHEIQWYVPRMQTGWGALGLFLIAFHFFLPFVILLSRAAKRAPALLGAIAVGLLVAHLLHVVWLVVPSARTHGFSIAWSDPVALAIVGVAWGWLWRRAYRGRHVPGTVHA